MKLLHLQLVCLFLFFNSYLLFSNGREIEYNKLKEIEHFLHDKTPFEQLVILDRLISQHSSSIELYKMKAKVELTTNDYLGVIKTVLKILKRSNEDIELLRLLAVSYFNLNDLKRATFYFNKILEQAPEDGVALFYLSLIEPSPQNGSTTAVDSRDTIDIAELLTLFNRQDNSNDIPFAYLLDRTEIDLNDKRSYNFIQHQIILLNSADAVERFKKVKYSYDSNSFTPDLMRAGTYKRDNLDEFVKLDNLDENFIIGGIHPEGYISFNFSTLNIGSIIEFKVKYTIKPDQIKGLAEHFYFTTLNKTIKKELRITKPQELKLAVKLIGKEVVISDEVAGKNIVMSYSMLTPPLLKNEDKRKASGGPAEELIISTYETLPALQESYPELFAGLFSGEIDDIKSELTLEERIKSVYQKQQSEILQSDKNSFEFNSIEETLRYHYDRTVRSTARFIESLNGVGVEAYAVIVKDEDLSTLYSDPVHPYLYNHGLIYIAAQKGLDKGFFLDISAPYIDYRNLSPALQGREALILKKDGSIESIYSPVISSENNIIEEKYLVKLSSTGTADLRVTKNFTGAFSTLLRSETSDLTGDELIKHLLKLDGPLNKDFKRDSVEISGYEMPSGAVNLDLTTYQRGFTEIFFDGSQVLKEDIKPVSPLFRFPHRSSTAYTVPFLFTYKKSSEYIFPADYIIMEHNLRSFSRENRYLYFNFEPQKIAENRFIFNFEFSIKSREIAPADLMEVNIFVNTLLEHFNIEVTMTPPASFDYNSFFEQLIAEYSDPSLYQAYIERLIESEELDKAEEIALKGDSTFNDNLYFKTILAFIYLEQKEYEKSEKLLEEVLNRDGDNPEIYKFLIGLYKKSGNKRALEETTLKAYSKFPDEADIVTEIVNFYQNNGEYEKAIVILKERLESSPDTNKARYYSELGYTYFLQKDYTLSEQHFLKAIELNGNDAYALNNLAWLYCERAIKIDEAIGYAERACAIDNSKDSFLDTLAEAYYLKGEYKKALEAITKALELSPESDYIKGQFEKIKRAYENRQKGENNGE